MRTSDVERQRKSQQRKRDKLQKIVDQHLADVRVFTEERDGKQVVTFDMSVETDRIFNEVAAAEGTTLDAILRDLVAKNVRQWATLKLLKEARERKEQIRTAKGEVRRLKDEVVFMERQLAELRAQKGE